jgi:hypothetical protein
MRHTTRGGWKPIKHERILKPEVQKDEEYFSGSGREQKKSSSVSSAIGGSHGPGKEKDINI